MVTPPPSITTTSTLHQIITPLNTFLFLVSLLSASAVSTAFYLVFESLTAAILTFVLYFLALILVGCTFLSGHSSVVTILCYPRYDMLSNRRKSEVDEVRERGLKRLLERFTLTLEEEHVVMMHKTTLPRREESSSSSSTVASSVSSEDSDVDVELGHHHHHHGVSSRRQHHNNTVKNDDNDIGHHDAVVTSYPTREENNDNIAVMLQQLHKNQDNASCDGSSTPVSAAAAASSSSVTTEDSAETSHACPGGTEVVIHRGSSSNQVPTEDNNAAAVSTTTNTLPPIRKVPITAVDCCCPICLSNYEPSQTICYSSNQHQCPHVFHSECIVKWFVEMGRKNEDIVIRHYGGGGTTITNKLNEESYLLDYTLSCPCCRQPFVQREQEEEKSSVDKSDGMRTDRTSKGETEVEEMEEEEEEEDEEHQ